MIIRVLVNLMGKSRVCRLLHDDMKDSGLLPVLARLVKGYSARHSPRHYAVDVVAALHTTLRLLTRLNTSGIPLSIHQLIRYDRIVSMLRCCTPWCGCCPAYTPQGSSVEPEQ